MSEESRRASESVERAARADEEQDVEGHRYHWEPAEGVRRAGRVGEDGGDDGEGRRSRKA